MVRTLALGFGAVTALAVAGSLTPTGQAMLGLRHPAEKATTVTVIQDKPAAIPAPAQSVVATPTPAPSPAPAARAGHAQPSPGAGPQSRPVPPAAQRPPAAQPAPQQGGQGGPGGLAGVANILLNLPQILDQTHVGPAHGPDSRSESRPADSQPTSQEPPKIKKKHYEPEQQHKSAGDDN
jgi:hypothetical protein